RAPSQFSARIAAARTSTTAPASQINILHQRVRAGGNFGGGEAGGLIREGGPPITHRGPTLAKVAPLEKTDGAVRRAMRDSSRWITGRFGKPSDEHWGARPPRSPFPAPRRKHRRSFGVPFPRNFGESQHSDVRC